MAGESAGLEKFAALIFIKPDVGSKLLLALFIVITEHTKMFKINVMNKNNIAARHLSLLLKSYHSCKFRLILVVLRLYKILYKTCANCKPNTFTLQNLRCLCLMSWPTLYKMSPHMEKLYEA